jgi:DNA segregation ATPase FtsK/SpoIIIE-like protein
MSANAKDLGTGCRLCGGNGCLFCAPAVPVATGPAPVLPPTPAPMPVVAAAPVEESRRGLASPSLASPCGVGATGERVVFVPARGGRVSDEQVRQATAVIKECGRATTSLLQRRLRLGYTQACNLMDLLEEKGIVGPTRGMEPREILV